ncbi:MAG: acetyl-CoA carboxylase biotin carboxylase subunit [Oscillospiraceae bacterium]|jgi:acetyl-CoA carboxylase biotin carboxylase subunit|nr:acetyl-CoA carboxylase biotin carboxylase subunit [Oscillospiraceae bacterium]
MIRRVLIANRGEIAVRIIRSCRDMNIEMVTVYSEADRDALFASLSTASVCIGPARASESYLNQDNIIAAALKSGCDAVHPGYGFLSENAGFAERVIDAGLIFIGPAPEAIRSLGDKAVAKRLMRQHGVPVIPGSDGVAATIADAKAAAEQIGYPVLVKASAGGGGRGMRRADDERSLETAFAEASAEASAAFGNGDLYVEKLILNPRHIEVQLIADKHGNVICLGERECSVQRRSQKILEEAPSKAVSAELRAKLTDYAVKAAKAANYENAGTVEFVLAPDGEAYFIEMNTRLQVEHPVTEAITGIDIVREQIRVASGHELSVTQPDITYSGHAIECRLCAEDAENGFMPSSGVIDFVHLPGGFGIRVDTAIFPGYEVSPYYDSMLAKVIAHGKTRNEAVFRMRRALEELIVRGVKTNLSQLYMVLYNRDFLTGNYDTGILNNSEQPKASEDL